MNTRKLILLSSIGLLFIVYLVQIFAGRGDSIKTISLNTVPDRIVIGSDEELVLERTGEKWTFTKNKYTVDRESIEEMLKTFSSLRVLQTVSTTGNHARFELDDESSLLVRAYADGKVIRSIHVGKDAAGHPQNYVRIDNGRDVLLVSGNLRRLFGKSIEELREREVYQVRPNEIRSVRVEGAYNWSMSLQDERWVFGDSSMELDQEKTRTWVTGMNQVRANSFPPEGTALAIDDAELYGRFILELADRTVEIRIGPKNESGHYLCRSNEISWPFYLTTWVVDRMIKNPKDLER